MSEQRRSILGMLAEGKITADEAERLIAALEPDPPPSTRSDVRPAGKPKYLRFEMNTVDNGEPGRINIRVPLQLLRAGVQLAALIPPRAIGAANAELTKAGVPIDLGQLKPEQLEALVDHLDDVSIEMDQPDAKLRVFCE